MFETNAILELTFWICLVLVVYAYPGYPIVIWCLACLFGRRTSPPETPSAELPRISLLIAAFNEESVIAARIENALAIDYPLERREIVVATDGCSDATAEIVRGYAARGVRLLEYTRRRGKATVLNESIPQLFGEVVILSDANTFTDLDAARRLARWFADPRIGVVCGRLILTDPATGSNVDSLYWKYESYLKKCEGMLCAILGANGGIYALRRTCFTPIPNDTIVDDFVLPLQARLRTRCGITYDASAIAREETPANISAEFRRRSRIGAGAFQSAWRLWRLLNPMNGWIAFTFFSHKILRWACPVFLILLLSTSLLLRDNVPYQVMLLAQVVFYALSAIAPVIPTTYGFMKPLRLTTMFTGMNIALLLGLWRWASGVQGGTWHRTARPGERPAL